jgi:hypothetical protein
MHYARCLTPVLYAPAIAARHNHHMLMNQLQWHSETLSVTAVTMHARTHSPREHGEQMPIKGRPLARIGFALLGLALPVLATGQGRALLAGVLARYFHYAVRPKRLVSSRRCAQGLPAGPG